MSVISFATFKLNSSFSIESPEIKGMFSALASRTPEGSFGPCSIFVDDRDKQIVYFITGWESSAAHAASANKEENKKLMEAAAALATPQAAAEIELDISNLPEEANALAYIKKTDGVPYPLEALPTMLWHGHGTDTKTPGVIHQFAAFTEVKRDHHTIDECTLMERVRL
ncbi:hypothetical protein CPC08DRAFT_171317 [Agrocybe pediades]|nr:hypothetical protein CPC08DRAFT_171317 [Agrocybe pediades]